MTHQHRFFCFSVLAVIAVGLGWGYGKPTTHARAASAHSIGHRASSGAVTVATATVPQGQGSCNPEVFIDKIERTEIGTITETFEVSFTAASSCFTEVEVSLLVTRADGSQRSDKKKFSPSFRKVSFKLGGKRDGNLTKTAKAVVNATGVLAAKGGKIQSLAIGAGVGSSGSSLSAAPTPTPVATPTFVLQGSVINSQTGTPLEGVKLIFELVGLPRRVASSVETNSLGRWLQGGFPVGRQVRVTASKRFFIIEPAERLVGDGGALVRFTGRPNEIGAEVKPTPVPAQTFTAGGRVVVDSLSQGTQTLLPGATITFKVLNAKPGQANVPGAVTTGKDGRWTQAGFTVGSLIYQASVSKPGVTFSSSTANFGTSNPNTVVDDVGFIGTVK